MYTFFSPLDAMKSISLGTCTGLTDLFPFEGVDDPDIDRAPADDQLVIDDVLHDMCQPLLAEADAGVAQADILTVIFVGIFEVGFAFHVVALAFAEQEGVFQMLHVSYATIFRLLFLILIISSLNLTVL